MAITYDPISTTTLGSAGTVTFTSLPTTYTDLKIIISGGESGGSAAFSYRFNGDSGNFYSWTALYANASAMNGSSTNLFTAGQLYGAAGTATQGLTEFTIFDYTNSAINKYSVAKHVNVSSGIYNGGTIMGKWTNTAAITSIQIGGANSVGNLTAGTTVSLYGIKRA